MSIETLASEIWAAAAHAAVIGGATPPVGGWKAVDPSVKRYYCGLAIAVEKDRGNLAQPVS